MAVTRIEKEYSGLYQNLHVLSRTISSRVVVQVLHRHGINQRITSKLYHDTYNFHENLLEFFSKIPDFLGIFRKISIFLYFLNFGRNFREIAISVEIFEKSQFSSNFGKQSRHPRR